MLSKTTWYRKRSKVDLYSKSTGAGKKKKNDMKVDRVEQKTVLFIEQTHQGELGRRLRELLTRITPLLGFGVKVVERTGSSLRSKFPQASLW